MSFKIKKIQIAADYLRNQGEFRINAIKWQPEFRNRADKEWQPINDFQMQTWLLQIKQITDRHGSRFDIKDLRMLLHSFDFAPKVNPLIDKFSNIEHLGQGKGLTEVDKWINGFKYISNPKVAQKYWRHWFYGCMRNLMTAYYYEHILIIIGKQSAGKSFAIQHGLASPFKGYYTDHFSWGATKDDLIQLAINFIIYDDEFSATNKATIDKVKSVTSRDHIGGVRAAYKEFPQDYMRIANFIATSNQDKILTDMTGNRRFLILHIEEAIRDVINNIDYELLWSQVWNHYYIEGITEELSPIDINRENEQYRIIDREEEIIDKHVDFANTRAQCYTTYDLIVALNRLGARLNNDTLTQRRINAIMRRKGLHQRVAKVKGRSMRVWDVTVSALLIGESDLKKPNGPNALF